MRRAAGAWLAWFLCALTVSGALGCSEAGGELLVEVRTGLVPGPEFTTIETLLVREGSDGAATLVRSATAAARFGQDFRSARRVALFSSVEPGAYAVRVTLLRPDGATILVSRSVALIVGSQRRVVRVVLDRGCVGVECPAPGGSPALTECLGGRCVDPRCEPPDPTFCGELYCNGTSDCPTGPACAAPACLDGVCELLPLTGGDAACPEGTWCSVRAGGCVPFTPPPPDAGPDATLVCGTVCTGMGGPCEVGYWDCSAGAPICTGFLHLPVGTDCGAGGVCDARGDCVACPAGIPCRVGCEDGVVDCSTGALRCVTTAPAPAGGSCDPTGTRLAGLDDDTSPFLCTEGACRHRATITFTPSPVELREGGGPLRVTATLSGAVAGGLSLPLHLPRTTGVDLVGASGGSTEDLTIRFPDAATTASFEVRAANDALANGTRPFTIETRPATSTDARFDGLDPDELSGLLFDACDAGLGDCNGVLRDGCETSLRATTSCGGCGRACPADPPNAAPGCASGICGIRCDPGWGDCNGLGLDGCEESLASASHCGACGRACDGATPVCLARADGSYGCVAACTPPETLCGVSACVDTSADPTHCGDCDTACPDHPRASAACVGGSCALACDAGYADCNGVASDGCEAPLDALSSCGACGTVCDLANAFESCGSGRCELVSCEASWADCDGNADNGCETRLGTTNDCAACGDVCPGGLANTAGTSCVANACVPDCVAGFADCDGWLANGCESDLLTDATCGSCTTACGGAVASGADRCVAGVCELTCDPGAADCNGVSGDGCEVTLGTTGNCTACGDVCPFPNASGDCTAGMCTLGACAGSYLDCNRAPEDGCELLPGAPCTPVGLLCNLGSVGCNSARGRPTCSSGARLPPGSACGAGGTCDASGNCLCPAGTPVNTPCGLDSVCAPDGRCVRNQFWEVAACSATPTGNSFCTGRGFARATSAYGYSWFQCAGPNASLGSLDNCLEYDADRTRCVRWLPGSDCAGSPLDVPRYGAGPVREFGGPPDHVFRITDFWGRGCGGWNPGYSVRTRCEF